MEGKQPPPTLEEHMEEGRSYKTTSRLQTLSLELYCLRDKLKDPSARQYLDRGVLRRVPIVRINIRSIFDYYAYSGRTEVLEWIEERPMLDMHICSFFYHCYGILDNAAWCLGHEKKFHKLGDNRAIGFYKEPYQKWLKDCHPKLLQVLEDQKGTYKDMENIRHAIAHRKPICVPHAITDEQKKEQVELLLEAEKHQIGSEEREELTNRAYVLGVFTPVLYVDGDELPEYSLRSYPLELAEHTICILEAFKIELG